MMICSEEVEKLIDKINEMTDSSIAWENRALIAEEKIARLEAELHKCRCDCAEALNTRSITKGCKCIQ